MLYPWSTLTDGGLLLFAYYISSGGDPQTRDTFSNQPILSEIKYFPRGILAKNMKHLLKHFNVDRFTLHVCVSLACYVPHFSALISLQFGNRRSLGTNGNFLRSILMKCLSLTRRKREREGCWEEGMTLIFL